ncbi:SDR family oxidoreductase [Leifsonia sp. RAF41]|uniref:SDR family oxidoreductase n=1 Tax=Leifsonia sp. RAF41 TaxID=3233056 RepID=UPI003F9A8223
MTQLENTPVKSGDLSGENILVVGGSGGVGEGAVRALLARGANVIATGRSKKRLDAFEARINNESLSTLVLDSLAPQFAADVEREVAAFGPLSAVIVAVASWGDQGAKPLLSLEDDEWSALIEQNLTSVFRAYRALVPLIAPGGALIQLNGMSAEIPFPGNGVVGLTAAAGKSLTVTLAEELRRTGIRVYEIILGVVRTRQRQLAGIDNELWLSGDEIGDHLADLITGTSPLAATTLQYFVDKTIGPTPTVPRLR